MLQLLVEKRCKLVEEKTRCSNRITSHLKMYFPQLLDWFDEIGSHIAAAFLPRWPDLVKLQRARPATMQQFFFEHNSRNAQRITERLDQISRARAGHHRGGRPDLLPSGGGSVDRFTETASPGPC